MPGDEARSAHPSPRGAGDAGGIDPARVPGLSLPVPRGAEQVLRGSRDAVFSAGSAGWAFSHAAAFLPASLRVPGVAGHGVAAGFAGVAIIACGAPTTVAGGAVTITVEGAACAAGCGAGWLRSVFAVPVLVAVATAGGAGGFGASPRAPVII